MQKRLAAFARRLHRSDRTITAEDRICDIHFYEKDIIRKHEDVVINGKLIKVGSPKPPVLRPDALPSIFPGCPESMNLPERKRRKSPRKRVSSTGSDQTGHPQRRKLFHDSDQEASTSQQVSIS